MRIFIILTIIFTISFSNQIQFDKNLTQKEKEYLKSKKVIKMCVYPDYMPFMCIKNNQFIGLTADFMKLIQKKLPIQIQVVKIDSFDKSIEKIKKRECDISPMFIKKRDDKVINFTIPYITIPLVITTTTDKPFIYEIKNILDKKIAVVKGHLTEILKNKYSNINLIEVNSIKEGLDKVVSKECYAFIDNLATINYKIKKHYPNKLKISGMIQKNLQFGIATRKDEPILNSILNKTISSLNEDEIMSLFNKWVFKEGVQKIVDYSLIIKITIVFLIIIFTISYFLYRLTKLQQQILILNKALEKRVQEEIKKNKEKEQQLLLQSRLAQMGEIISIIAHQWRQPLNAISANVNDLLIKIMLNNIDNKYLQEKLKKIADIIKETSETIDDFRNFYKKDTQKKETTLSDIAKKTLTIIQPIIKEKNIKLIMELNSKLKIKVKENELKHTILTIVKNAQDILLEKKIKNPEIIIKTYDKDNCAYIEIKDNGGGIDKEIMDKIFDPYFTTKGKDGTGIGLNMAKNIVEKNHNGVLSVKNDETGAIFTIKICKEDK